MYSNFWQSWIHHQSALTDNVPDQKKNPAIEGPPEVCIQMCTSRIKPIKILPLLCHGGNLKMWHDIGWFLASCGYTEKSPHNTSTVIVKLHPQRWTSSKRGMNSSISRASHLYKPPAHQRRTPPHYEHDRVKRTHCSVCFRHGLSLGRFDQD
jgi:hypothetical protein